MIEKGINETLIDRIREIENIPEFVETVDKNKEIREEFKKFRVNPVVRAVMEGNTTFSEEYRKAFGEYYKNVHAPYRLPTIQKENIKDLELCIGYSNINNFTNATLWLLNPFTGGAVGVASGVYISSLQRRKFLSATMLVPLFAAGGALFGRGASHEVQRLIVRLEQNAQYLDDVYTRLYKKADISKEPTYTDRRSFFTTLTHRA